MKFITQFLYAREPDLHPIERNIVQLLTVDSCRVIFVGNVVERMAASTKELKIDNVQDKKPVLDKRLPTKVSYIIKFLWLHRYN